MKLFTTRLSQALTKLELVRQLLEAANLNLGLATADHSVEQVSDRGPDALWRFTQRWGWRFVRDRYDLMVVLECWEGNVDNSKCFMEIAMWDSILYSRRSVFWGYKEYASGSWRIRNDGDSRSVTEKMAMRRVEELVASFTAVPEDAPIVEPAQTVAT